MSKSWRLNVTCNVQKRKPPLLSYRKQRYYVYIYFNIHVNIHVHVASDHYIDSGHSAIYCDFIEDPCG